MPSLTLLKACSGADGLLSPHSLHACRDRHLSRPAFQLVHALSVSVPPCRRHSTGRSVTVSNMKPPVFGAETRVPVFRHISASSLAGQGGMHACGHRKPGINQHLLVRAACVHAGTGSQASTSTCCCRGGRPWGFAVHREEGVDGGGVACCGKPLCLDPRRCASGAQAVAADTSSESHCSTVYT